MVSPPLSWDKSHLSSRDTPHVSHAPNNHLEIYSFSRFLLYLYSVHPFLDDSSLFLIMATSPLLTRGAGSLQRCVLFAVFAVIFVGLVQYLDPISSKNIFTSTQSHRINRLPLQPIEATCRSVPGYLKDSGFSTNITYSRRCIKPVFSDNVDRDIVTNVTAALITNTTTVSLTGDCIERLPCDAVELLVPKPDPQSQGQYTHLIFGVATTYGRLRESKSTFAHWLSDSGATLIGLIVDDPRKLLALDFAALEGEYAALGMNLRLVTKHDPAHSTEQSHMMLIDDMLTYADTATPVAAAAAQTLDLDDTPHYLGILDDDTFFPSLHALSTALAQHNHTRPQYLGQLTENAGLLPQGILGAFGGAGVFLSLALAREIHPYLDACRSDRGGDMQIMECIHAHSRARLTRIEGLHQCDIVGDSAGFYESGRRVLSMHHWKSWNHLPPTEMAAITKVCGGCFLARFVFGSMEGDNLPGEAVTAVLNNGYSINVYSAGVALPDLSFTEQTWDNWDRDPWKEFEWSLGPLRHRVGKDKKKSYHLMKAVPGENGELTQVYVHRGGEEGRDDEVIELVWQPF